MNVCTLQFHNITTNSCEEGVTNNMKRKLLNKILSMALVGTMVMGMAACGKQPVASTEGTETNVAGTEVSTEVATEVVEEELTYPLKDAVKLSMWTYNQPPVSSVYADWTESPYHIGLQENTGIELEWIYPVAGANVDEAYNLMLTDDELPHMITNDTSLADALLLAKDGMIYDLTDYLPRYAPDYWEYLNSDPELLRSVKADDGHIYGVYGHTEGDYNGTYIGPVIRQDWLEECGLEMPVTLEDWEKVLVAFKEKYGATFGFNKKRYNMGIASGTNAQATIFSYAGIPGWYVDETGKVQFGQMDEEWKKSIEVLHKWYEMGLIDQDSFTMDDKSLRAKALANEVGVSITALSQLTNWIADAEAQGTGADWVGMEYPRVAEGVATSRIQSGTRTTATVTMVTTRCSEEELITALKWLNYGFTEEGRMYCNFGKEGDTYYLDAEGKPQWTEKITSDPDGAIVAAKKYSGTHSGTVATVQAADLVKLINAKTSADAVYKWIDNTDNSKYVLPPLALTEEETITYSDKFDSISARCAEMAMKYIIGEESLDNFDAFLEELRKMGIEECQAIQQAAFDRYLAK